MRTRIIGDENTEGANNDDEDDDCEAEEEAENEEEAEERRGRSTIARDAVEEGAKDEDATAFGSFEMGTAATGAVIVTCISFVVKMR